MKQFLIRLCIVIFAAMMAGCLPEERWAPFSGPWPPGATHASNGTGIVLGNGFVLTAAHVTHDCIKMTIATESGKIRAIPVEVKQIEYDGEPLGFDLALVHSADPELTAIPPASFIDLWPDDLTMAKASITSPAPSPSAKVSLVGFPNGTIPTAPATTSVTELTAQKPSGNQSAHVWASLGNAAPGFSGAPIADEKGNVVGMAFRGVAAGDTRAVEKVVSSGLGIAAASRDIIDFGKANGITISPPRSESTLSRLNESLVEVFCFR